MSAILTGAVFSCGPSKASLRLAMVAITDNSDDYGFACPSIETIAAKACCDERTAMRHVQALERDGWMKVRRKVLFGKGNVYFIDIAKLGIEVNPKMRRSPLHVEVAKQLEKKRTGDNLSPEFLRVPEKSGDNPQGVQVTKTADSGDKKHVAILKNRKEPLLNLNNPLPPSQANGERVSNADAESSRNANEELSGVRDRPLLLGELSACSAVQRVMRECNWTDRRLAPVIEEALRQYRVKNKHEDFVTGAELMIRMHREFVRAAHLLRYTLGPKKFIQHGHWITDALWPWDEAKLKQVRRL